MALYTELGAAGGSILVEYRDSKNMRNCFL